MINTIFFYEKQQKNIKKVYGKTQSSIFYCELAPVTCNVTAKNIRDTEKNLHI